ncbi:hypothetical protein TRFO_11175 [Tritrichomonas foetus]|uniref:Uncharacterized protein n=1 Tax=Tritrichomonas foetus TaxID=1144522 RepID=A0A1J4J4Q4_9EUKA|nr:hypothetical protein TRFO_11175 [Tritrichomonas foetus]|eukprot:OHS94320.1 hypothetical protein TRFO_11175 [Tritrichomonas foetus]
MGSINYLIVQDLVFQKYELIFQKNFITGAEVLNEISKVLPIDPNQKIEFALEREDYNKMCLFMHSTLNPTLSFIPGNFIITPNIMYDPNSQFYIYNPLSDVRLTIEMMNFGKIDLIFPKKLCVDSLKAYLRKKVLIVMYPQLAVYEFNIICDKSIVNSNVEISELSGKILQLNFTDTPFMGSGAKLYYKYLDKIDYIEYQEIQGINYSIAEHFIIEKIRILTNNNIPNGKLTILFNSVVQSEKFPFLSDLFCDNNFYCFTIVFDSNNDVLSKSRKCSVEYCMLGSANNQQHPPQYFIRSTQILSIVPFQQYQPQFMHQLYMQPQFPPQQMQPQFPPQQIHPPMPQHQGYPPPPEQTYNNTYSQPKQSIQQPIQQQQDTTIEAVDGDEEEDEEPVIEDEHLLDMFCYYFEKYLEKNKIQKTPPPSYFASLTPEDEHLLKIFQPYYKEFRDQINKFAQHK